MAKKKTAKEILAELQAPFQTVEKSLKSIPEKPTRPVKTRPSSRPKPKPAAKKPTRAHTQGILDYIFQDKPAGVIRPPGVKKPKPLPTYRMSDILLRGTAGFEAGTSAASIKFEPDVNPRLKGQVRWDPGGGWTVYGVKSLDELIAFEDWQQRQWEFEGRGYDAWKQKEAAWLASKPKKGKEYRAESKIPFAGKAVSEGEYNKKYAKWLKERPVQWLPGGATADSLSPTLKDTSGALTQEDWAASEKALEKGLPRITPAPGLPRTILEDIGSGVGGAIDNIVTGRDLSKWIQGRKDFDTAAAVDIAMFPLIFTGPGALMKQPSKLVAKGLLKSGSELAARIAGKEEGKFIARGSANLVEKIGGRGPKAVARWMRNDPATGRIFGIVAPEELPYVVSPRAMKPIVSKTRTSPQVLEALRKHPSIRIVHPDTGQVTQLVKQVAPAARFGKLWENSVDFLRPHIEGIPLVKTEQQKFSQTLGGIVRFETDRAKNDMVKLAQLSKHPTVRLPGGIRKWTGLKISDHYAIRMVGGNLDPAMATEAHAKWAAAALEKGDVFGAMFHNIHVRGFASAADLVETRWGKKIVFSDKAGPQVQAVYEQLKQGGLNREQIIKDLNLIADDTIKNRLTAMERLYRGARYYAPEEWARFQATQNPKRQVIEDLIRGRYPQSVLPSGERAFIGEIDPEVAVQSFMTQLDMKARHYGDVLLERQKDALGLARKDAAKGLDRAALISDLEAKVAAGSDINAYYDNLAAVEDGFPPEVRAFLSGEHPGSTVDFRDKSVSKIIAKDLLDNEDIVFPKGLQNVNELSKSIENITNLAQLGEADGRYYYQQAAKDVLEMSNRFNEMPATKHLPDGVTPDQVAQIFAILSQGDNPMENAWLAIHQFRREGLVWADRYPPKAQREIVGVLSGHPWAGRNRSAFYMNIIEDVNPTAAENVGIKPVTVDHAIFGGESAIAPKQFDAAYERTIQRVADVMGWDPKEVQAAALAQTRDLSLNLKTSPRDWKEPYGLHAHNKPGEDDARTLEFLKVYPLEVGKHMVAVETGHEEPILSLAHELLHYEDSNGIFTIKQGRALAKAWNALPNDSIDRIGSLDEYKALAFEQWLIEGGLSKAALDRIPEEYRAEAGSAFKNLKDTVLAEIAAENRRMAIAGKGAADFEINIPREVRDIFDSLFNYKHLTGKGAIHGGEDASGLGEIYLPDVPGLPISITHPWQLSRSYSQALRAFLPRSGQVATLNYKDSALSKQLKGFLLQSGRFHHNVIEGPLQAQMKAARIAGTADLRDAVLPLVKQYPQEADDIAIKLDLSKPVHGLPMKQAMLLDLDSPEKIGRKELARITQNDIENLQEHLFSGTTLRTEQDTEKVAAALIARETGPIKNVGWVSRKVLMDTGIFDPPTFNITLKNSYKTLSKTHQYPGVGDVADAINDLMKAQLLLLHPAYYGMNIIGNLVMNFMHEGVMMPWNTLRAAFIHADLGVDAVLIDHFMGGGLASVATMRGAFLNKRLVGGMQNFANALVDRIPRRAAFIHEARRMGFKSAADIKLLLTDPQYSEALRTAAQRAKWAMVDFENMSRFEKDVVSRFIFVYPWIKGATYWTARFPKDHPLQAIAYAGMYTYQQEAAGDALPGGRPTYLDLYLPGYPMHKNNPYIPNKIEDYIRAIVPGEVNRYGKQYPFGIRLRQYFTWATPYEIGINIEKAITGDPSGEALTEMLQPFYGAWLTALTGWDPFRHQEVPRSAKTLLHAIDPRQSPVWQEVGRVLRTEAERKQEAEKGRLYPRNAADDWWALFLGSIAGVPVNPITSHERSRYGPLSMDQKTEDWTQEAETLTKQPVAPAFQQYYRNGLIYGEELKNLKKELNKTDLTPQEISIARLRAFIKINPEMAGSYIGTERQLKYVSISQADRFSDRLWKGMGMVSLARYQAYLDKMEAFYASQP